MQFIVDTQLLSEAQSSPPSGSAKYQLIRRVDKDKCVVKARIASSNLADLNTVFVLPVISSSDESLRQDDAATGLKLKSQRECWSLKPMFHYVVE